MGSALRGCARKIGWVWVGVVCHVFGRFLCWLQVRWAGRSGDIGFPVSMWSACMGSLGVAGSPQIAQCVDVSRMCLAMRW
jgi:hypothetical protein